MFYFPQHIPQVEAGYRPLVSDVSGEHQRPLKPQGPGLQTHPRCPQIWILPSNGRSHWHACSTAMSSTIEACNAFHAGLHRRYSTNHSSTVFKVEIKTKSWHDESPCVKSLKIVYRMLYRLEGQQPLCWHCNTAGCTQASFVPSTICHP